MSNQSGAHSKATDRNEEKNAGSRLHRIEFDRVTKELTRILSSMVYCEFVCSLHLPMLDQLESINSHIVVMSSGPKDGIKLAQHNLRAQNEFLQSSFTGTLMRSQYLAKRAQALVQTLYSLISQRENALSMRDNAELKKISENQSRVAMAASRDSAAMRVIAAITTVFLPATFTAVRDKAAKILISTDMRQTFFSTTFFDFQANSDPTIVSWWLWLYL